MKKGEQAKTKKAELKKKAAANGRKEVAGRKERRICR